MSTEINESYFIILSPDPSEFEYVFEKKGKELLRLTPEMVTLLAAAFAASAEAGAAYMKTVLAHPHDNNLFVAYVDADARAQKAWLSVDEAARERARKGEVGCD